MIMGRLGATQVPWNTFLSYCKVIYLYPLLWYLDNRVLILFYILGSRQLKYYSSLVYIMSRLDIIEMEIKI